MELITGTGMHSQGGVTGIAEWGINRFGRTFTTAISQPLVVRQDCNFRLTTGKVDHSTPVFNAAVSFGLDSAGNPTACPGTGAYYLKIIWSGPAEIRTIIWPINLTETYIQNIPTIKIRVVFFCLVTQH